MQITINGNNCKCLKCGEYFAKSKAVVKKVKEKKSLPPLLQKIALAKRGIVVDASACPFCGSASLLGIGESSDDGRKYVMCSHCKQKVEREKLIKYGEKPIVKINNKREMLP